MNILFLCSRFPYPPNRGDKLRAFNIIRELSSANHRLYLISFIAESKELNYLDHLKRYCEEVIVEYLPPYRSQIKAALGLFSKRPLQIAYYQSRKMRRRIHEFLNQNSIDLIYVHLFRMASYVEHHQNLYKLVDLTDAVSSEMEKSLEYRSGINKWIYSLEFSRIREYERKITTGFDECWVISQRDAEILKKLSPSSNIVVMPNGVNMNFFRPLNNSTKEKIIIFVGHLRVDHNIDAVLFFYHDIFPLIIKKYPETNFYIVGPDPHSKIKNLCKDPRVIVTGFIEDLNHYLNKAMVFVAPLRFASGIQNKILEAMSAGVPVVCSSLANEGLQAKVGQDILVADNPLEFANLVNDLMNNPKKVEFLTQNAREFVRRNFNWNLAVDRITGIERMIRGRPAPERD
jgi:sugar transferase (PEP-CTERM/EpsH1 system associated)